MGIFATVMTTFFLLTIGFLPFSTALIGRYYQEQLPVIIYGANVIATKLLHAGYLVLFCAKRPLGRPRT
jgi:uncharacterized membrane protein